MVVTYIVQTQYYEIATSSHASPLAADTKQKTAVLQLSGRLQSCWEQDLNWDLHPQTLRQVCYSVMWSVIILFAYFWLASEM